ncbi:hypothetical protein, partial [Anaerosporobacter sp.]|uniref:hypothetical protein n=1 Tax=Anaerosporobacter sp. TaxID=1872529 RepID=UPI00289B7399
MKKGIRFKILVSIIVLTAFSIWASITNLDYIHQVHDDAQQAYEKSGISADSFTHVQDTFEAAVQANNIGIAIMIILAIIVIVVLTRSVISPTKRASKKLNEILT